jgi:hypothetical protein
MRTVSPRGNQLKGRDERTFCPSETQIREVASRIRNEWSEDERCRRAIVASAARRVLYQAIAGD